MAKCPSLVLEHPSVMEWRAGLKAARGTGSDEELAELYENFKKCAGKDRIMSRKEFLNNFTKKCKIDGEVVDVADVEALFNASAIDKDNKTVSLDEFMTIMIVMKGGDPWRKLEWAFHMYDKDSTGSLDPSEVESMFGLLSTETDEAKRAQMVGDLMKVLDKNKDTKISLDELKAGLASDKFMEEFMSKYVEKGKQVTFVIDAAFKKKSMMCLVM